MQQQASELFGVTEERKEPSSGYYTFVFIFNDETLIDYRFFSLLAIQDGIIGSLFLSGTLPPPLCASGRYLPLKDLLVGTKLGTMLFYFDLPSAANGVPFPSFAMTVVIYAIVCCVMRFALVHTKHDNFKLIIRQSMIASSVYTVALPSVSVYVYLLWALSPYDRPFLIVNSVGLERTAVFAILAGLITSFFGTIITVTFATIHKHGLYRPRRADRCANCRYALPVAGPASGPTVGPCVGPSADPTAAPCPECGWDRVSVPKRAWRNLRRFAFGALALTVFFYLGPLWISWLAVIL